ncbi:MAG: hypothetical protein PF569_02260 [Candidatus Woesearchaeota archaeon]|jgi:hypothetical protein|nr:hypothetical protein [Candidatus Woesearchaeota archaeon]
MKDNKKEKYSKFKRKFIHHSLFLISDALTIMMLIQIGDGIIAQTILGFFANAIELLKVQLLMEIKKRFKEWKLRFLPIVAIFILTYLGFAFVSGVASLNFTLLTISNKSFVSEVNNSTMDSFSNQIEDIDKDIESINNDIRSNQEDMRNIDPAIYRTAREQIQNTIQDLRSSKTELFNKREELVIQQQNEIEEVEIIPVDSFSLMAEKLNNGWDGSDVMYYLMLLLIFLLELSLVVTSEEAELEVNITEERKPLSLYVKALMDINGVRLNSDKKISELTGLSHKDCKYYKSLLQEWKYESTHLIHTGRGGSKANFTKKQILQIISARTKLGM